MPLEIIVLAERVWSMVYGIDGLFLGIGMLCMQTHVYLPKIMVFFGGIIFLFSCVGVNYN